MPVSGDRRCSWAQSAAPWHRHQDAKVRLSLGTSVLCEESAALIASLGVGPAPKVVCRSESATPPSSPFLQGRVQPVRYSVRPFRRSTCARSSHLRPLTLPQCSGPCSFRDGKASRAPRTRPSRPLAQTVSEQVRHRLRGTPASASWRPASIRRSVPVRVLPGTPHQCRCCAHRVGRPGPGPGGRLPSRAAGLCRGLGACSLPALAPPKPASPPAPDRLPGQRSTRFARSAPYGTARLLAVTHEAPAPHPAG